MMDFDQLAHNFKSIRSRYLSIDVVIWESFDFLLSQIAQNAQNEFSTHQRIVIFLLLIKRGSYKWIYGCFIFLIAIWQRLDYSSFFHFNGFSFQRYWDYGLDFTGVTFLNWFIILLVFFSHSLLWLFDIQKHNSMSSLFTLNKFCPFNIAFIS
eukprot:NODE_804_length_4102_cov_0.255309.p5 type:complete len:153 gc:universal NODE_804_length_4102_cov_0.255309:3237-2779(-)